MKSHDKEANLTTLQYRLYTNRAGYTEIDRIMRLCGQAHNDMIRRYHYLQDKGVSPTKIRRVLNEDNTYLKNHNQEWSDLARPILTGIQFRTERAFKREEEVEEAGAPKTKSPHQFQTLEINEPSKNHLKRRESDTKNPKGEVHIKGLPHLWFDADDRLDFATQPRVIRITRQGRILTLCLVVEAKPTPLPPAPHTIAGIDPGVKNRLTVVNEKGEYYTIPPLDNSPTEEKKKELQRTIQRCQDQALHDDRAYTALHWDKKRGKYRCRFHWYGRPSKKYLDARAQLQNCERKRQVRQSQHEHRFTTEIVRNHQTIAIEDTKLVNITKSAKGTAKNPGKNVKAKSGLNRSIREQRLGAIRDKLEYKASWYGREFIRVPAAYTSQTCPSCKFTSPENRPSRDYFQCQSCRTNGPADAIAGTNILKNGQKALQEKEINTPSPRSPTKSRPGAKPPAKATSQKLARARGLSPSGRKQQDKKGSLTQLEMLLLAEISPPKAGN